MQLLSSVVLFPYIYRVSSIARQRPLKGRSTDREVYSDLRVSFFTDEHKKSYTEKCRISHIRFWTYMIYAISKFLSHIVSGFPP
jgi:hypothetical protein